METALALSPVAGAAVVFVLAFGTVRFAIVYHRNNLASGLAAVVFGTALYFFGWWALIAFTAGALSAAWQWAASIARANERMVARRRTVLTRSRGTRVAQTFN